MDYLVILILFKFFNFKNFFLETDSKYLIAVCSLNGKKLLFYFFDYKIGWLKIQEFPTMNAIWEIQFDHELFTISKINFNNNNKYTIFKDSLDVIGDKNEELVVCATGMYIIKFFF